MASSYPKTDLIKNFLSIFLLNHSSNVFRSRHIVFKKVLLNQEYNIILLMGILNMQIQQGFVPPGDETAINWAPEHCAARSRWGSCTVVRCTSWRNHYNCSGLFFENCRIRIIHCPSVLVPFFIDFIVRTPKESIGLMYPQFWCHRPSQ